MEKKFKAPTARERFKPKPIVASKKGSKKYLEQAQNFLAEFKVAYRAPTPAPLKALDAKSLEKQLDSTLSKIQKIQSQLDRFNTLDMASFNAWTKKHFPHQFTVAALAEKECHERLAELEKLRTSHDAKEELLVDLDFADFEDEEDEGEELNFPFFYKISGWNKSYLLDFARLGPQNQKLFCEHFYCHFLRNPDGVSEFPMPGFSALARIHAAAALEKVVTQNSSADLTQLREAENKLKELQAELKYLKRHPEWNFHAMSDADKKKLLPHMKGGLEDFTEALLESLDDLKDEIRYWKSKSAPAPSEQPLGKVLSLRPDVDAAL